MLNDLRLYVYTDIKHGGESGIRTHAPLSQSNPLAEGPLIATWVSLQQIMAPRTGLEPVTTRLTVECSTN
jgi:hypothetical protein